MTGNAERPADTKRDEQVLRARARSLASATKDVAMRAHVTDLLVVRVGRARYAVPLLSLGGVVPLPDLMPLPGAPGFVAGVAHVHGRVMTVIHLSALLGEGAESPKAAIVIDVGAEAFALGVSAYESVAAAPTAGLLPLPAGASPNGVRYIAGLLDEGVGLLQLDRIIDDLLQGRVGVYERD